jgi:hypothetical protein
MERDLEQTVKKVERLNTILTVAVIIEAIVFILLI